MQCNMRYNIKYHTENDNFVIDGRKQYDDAIFLLKAVSEYQRKLVSYKKSNRIHEIQQYMYKHNSEGKQNDKKLRKHKYGMHQIIDEHKHVKDYNYNL